MTRARVFKIRVFFQCYISETMSVAPSFFFFLHFWHHKPISCPYLKNEKIYQAELFHANVLNNRYGPMGGRVEVSF